MTELRMDFELIGERVDVSAHGAIDIANVRMFAEFLEVACEKRAAVVVIDLSECDSIDSSGLATLARLSRPAPGQPRVLIGRASDAVTHVLELTGFDSILGFADPKVCPACSHVPAEFDVFCARCGSRIR